MKDRFLMSSVLHSHSHHGMACADSRPYCFCKNLRDNGVHGAADLDDRPTIFLQSSFPIYSIDLTEDRKLGYGFTSADGLEEVDIGPVASIPARADDNFIKGIWRLFRLGLYRDAWAG
jgi:hypothetical protein